MKHLKSYEEMNEGLKNWLATFLLMVNMGVVPPSIANATDKEKIEYISNLPKKEILAAQFIEFIKKMDLADAPLEFSWEQFAGNMDIKMEFEEIEPCIIKDGKTIKLNKEYIKSLKK